MCSSAIQKRSYVARIECFSECIRFTLLMLCETSDVLSLARFLFTRIRLAGYKTIALVAFRLKGHRAVQEAM